MTNGGNPYIAGIPLGNDQGFYGRQDILDWVRAELRDLNTNALVLHGQRRIGKTTVLLQLRRSLPRELILPIYIDLQDQATQPLGKVLSSLARKASDSAGIPYPNQYVFDDEGINFISEFLPELYTGLNPECRPVFLLDEFDVLDVVKEVDLPETVAAKTLFPFLRRVMSEDPRPAFVFVVGRRPADLRVDFTQIFKTSLSKEIWTLDKASAERLIRQAETSNSLKYTEAAIARILELANCHPYLTQLLCQRIWRQLHTKEVLSAPLVDVSEVNAAISETIISGDNAIEWLWEGLGPAEKVYASALAKIAQEGQPIPEQEVILILSAHVGRLRTSELEMAPRDMVKRRVLQEDPEHEYRFAVELFRLWVSQKKDLPDVVNEIDNIVPVAEKMFLGGQDLFYQGELDDAIRYFLDALKKNPQHFRARKYLGEAYLKLGRNADAVTELEYAYEIAPYDGRAPLTRAYIEYADELDKKGDEENALGICKKALEVSPKEQEVLSIRGRIWERRADTAIKKADFEAAIQAYREIENEEQVANVEKLKLQEKINTLISQTQIFEKRGAWAQAISGYEKLLGLSPDDKLTSEFQNALQRCQTEKQLSDDFARGKNELMRADYKAAENTFAEIITLRSNYSKDGQTAAQLLSQALVGRPPSRTARYPIIGIASAAILLGLVVVVGLLGIYAYQNQLGIFGNGPTSVITPQNSQIPSPRPTQELAGPPTAFPSATATLPPTPINTLALSVERLYLSDLGPITRRVGFGSLGIGVYPFSEGPFREGQPLQLNGIEYPHGIFAHAPSVVEYSLPQSFSSFSASIYIEGHPTCGADGVASFTVLLDGQEIYQSPTITYNDTQKPLPISFSIGEGNILTLKTNILDVITCDWTIWGDPYLEP